MIDIDMIDMIKTFLAQFSERLYAKVDKSRKSRVSAVDDAEITPLTTVLVNGGPHLTIQNETLPDEDIPDQSGQTQPPNKHRQAKCDHKGSHVPDPLTTNVF